MFSTDETPPPEPRYHPQQTRVCDLTRFECGFHSVSCTKEDGDAILRGHKTAAIFDGLCHIQRGDLIVFCPKDGISILDSSHPICSKVYEASYVYAVPDSIKSQIMVCFHPKEGFTYHPGDVGGDFPEDTITYPAPKLPKSTEK